MPAFDDDTAERRKQAEKERREAELALALRHKAVTSLYSTSEGRAFLWWLLQTGRAIGENPFRGDPYATAFTCGEQNVGQRIMADLIQCNPTGFADLLKEQENVARTKHAANVKPVDPDDATGDYADGQQPPGNPADRLYS